MACLPLTSLPPQPMSSPGPPGATMPPGSVDGAKSWTNELWEESSGSDESLRWPNECSVVLGGRLGEE